MPIRPRTYRKGTPMQCPATFVSKRINRRTFAYTADVHVLGDASVKGDIIVSGNLTVDGNLNASNVYCLGTVTVKGNVVALTISVGMAIHAGGTISASCLETGCDAEIMASAAGIGESIYDDIEGASCLDKLAHPEIRGQLEFEHDGYLNNLVAVRAGEDLICDVIDVKGDVEIGGHFDLDEGSIAGGLLAKSISLEGELRSDSEIRCHGDISGIGLFNVGNVTCLGSLEADSIHAEEGISVLGYLFAENNVTAGGNIQTGRWLAACGKITAGAFIKAGECVVADQGIEAGADYGILAGMSLPRSLWLQQGYVSAPIRPRRILTGRYVARRNADSVYDEKSRHNSQPIEEESG